tara:strand:- start:2485 stop:3024 length:540 start_codon:yes stop_codon:yes gene_type:complete
MKKKKKLKKGILFWITGLSGSGKTTLAKKIFPIIKKKYGPTIHLDGDMCRKIMNLKGFSFKERLSNAMIYSKISKVLTNQNVNVIFSLVGLMHKPRDWNKKNIPNYIEIYIKSEIKKIILRKKKKIYKNTKNLVGINIKAEFPKNPDIVLENNINHSLDKLSKDLLKKISNIVRVKKIN